MREVATYFTEQILSFLTQKREASRAFSCIFKTKEPIRTTVVKIQLHRTGKQKITGHVTLYGRLNEPSPEFVNLIVAALIDDSFFNNHLRKGLLIAGALFAWLTQGNTQLSLITTRRNTNRFRTKLLR